MLNILARSDPSWLSIADTYHCYHWLISLYRWNSCWNHLKFCVPVFCLHVWTIIFIKFFKHLLKKLYFFGVCLTFSSLESSVCFADSDVCICCNLLCTWFHITYAKYSFLICTICVCLLGHAFEVHTSGTCGCSLELWVEIWSFKNV